MIEFAFFPGTVDGVQCLNNEVIQIDTSKNPNVFPRETAGVETAGVETAGA